MTDLVKNKYRSIDICSVLRNERRGNELRKFIHLICDDIVNNKEKIQRGNQIFYAFVNIGIVNISELYYSKNYEGWVKEYQPIYKHFFKCNGKVC